jgi:hypothetical protein
MARYQTRALGSSPAMGSYDGRPAGPHDILVIAILRFSVFLWEKCHARRFFI